MTENEEPASTDVDSAPRRGALIIVATPIGNLGDLSPRARAALADADVIACEDTRRTRQLLSSQDIPTPRLLSVHEHNEQARISEVVALVAGGQRVALVTDAGMPAISDPGQPVVAAVAGAGLPVEVIPGPSAVVTALALSGIPAERFTFEGFLPRKGKERRDRLGAIAKTAATTVIYEAPSRVASTIGDLAEACGPHRPVAVARELTKLHEEVWRGDLAEAAAHLAATAARGEYVLVVGGSVAGDTPVEDDTILAALDDCRAAGLSNRDAAAEVAASLDLPKRRVYDLAVTRPRPAG